MINYRSPYPYGALANPDDLYNRPSRSSRKRSRKPALYPTALRYLPNTSLEKLKTSKSKASKASKKQELESEEKQQCGPSFLEPLRQVWQRYKPRVDRWIYAVRNPLRFYRLQKIRTLLAEAAERERRLQEREDMDRQLVRILGGCVCADCWTREYDWLQQCAR